MILLSLSSPLRLQEFVNKYEPHEILSQTEFDKLYKEIESTLHEDGQEMFVSK